MLSHQLRAPVAKTSALAGTLKIAQEQNKMILSISKLGKDVVGLLNAALNLHQLAYLDNLKQE